MAMILTAAIYGFALPAVALIFWKKKTGAPFWYFIAGAICFVLFSNVLESALHFAVLVLDTPVSRAISSSAVLYTLYGALAAGIFEETARLFGFKVMLKGKSDRACPVAYGIGHGGIEVILVLAVSYVVFLLIKLGFPMGDEAATAAMREVVDGLSTSTIALAMFERIPTMLIHIGLSMIVFVAVRQKGKIWLYFLAIVLHALVDVPAALFQFGAAIPLWVVEVSASVFAVLIILAGKKILDGAVIEEESAEEVTEE